MSVVVPVRASSTSVPRLTVDLDAVAANVRSIDRIVTGSIMAVVKADGFGHGAGAVARTALANGATSLGVATIAEALDLRAAGLDAPVLSWLNPVDADFEGAIRRGIQLAVPSLDHLRAVTSAATRAGRAAQVHIHVDCGMNRDGAGRDEWFALSAEARRAERRGNLDVVGAMSHLPCADQPEHPSTHAGELAFLEAVAVMRAAGLRPSTLHLAATAGALTTPRIHFDLCRIGAGLYGIGSRLRPAMTLTAPVVGLRDVAAGAAVGYGHAWVAARPTRLALVALGYGDGLPRIASGVAQVGVGGVRRALVGTISMDQIVVDVTDLPVTVGDDVTIFGGADSPTVEEWASWSHTIPHEIMTGLGARITRSFSGTR